MSTYRLKINRDNNVKTTTLGGLVYGSIVQLVSSPEGAGDFGEFKDQFFILSMTSAPDNDVIVVSLSNGAAYRLHLSTEVIPVPGAELVVPA